MSTKYSNEDLGRERVKKLAAQTRFVKAKRHLCQLAALIAAKGLLKFKPYLSGPEFNKLVYLMRGLAPVIIEDLIAKTSEV